MKFWFCVLVLVLCSGVNCFSLDREAFAITNYDLRVRVEPDQQRMGVRGKITLRNDSAQPQKTAVLQISSSLDWRSVKAAGNLLQYVTQPYTSDIDHTGALSEAIVSLPDAVAPGASVELEIGYEGVIVQDGTRLTRIGAPEDAAAGSDWDQISTKFTGVRGVGYVAWYPIATNSANLSEQNSLFETLNRWKSREAAAHMQIVLESPVDATGLAQLAVCNSESTRSVTKQGISQAECSYAVLGMSVPAFVMGDFKTFDRQDISVNYLAGDDVAAGVYADAAEKAEPLISDWFGHPREKAITADLPNSDASPFESGSLLLTPLTNTDAQLAGLAAAHQLTHAAFDSPRPWINEGLAHFAQALYLEQLKGRQAALDYMGLHRSVFMELEKQTSAADFSQSSTRSLIQTTSEEFYRSKAMYVWWMLREIVGDSALKKALAQYRPDQDKDPHYMPRLIEAQTQHDLDWFFNDWVYHDRGLPDFKVDSAFSRKMPNGFYILTFTVDNLGTAGAEVPLAVTFEGGEFNKRVEVQAKSKAVVRVEISGVPDEITVNDGSVPESDTSNNTFTVPVPEVDK